MSLFQKKSPERQRFKYKITEHHYDKLEDREQMDREFDNYGFRGWELISMNPVETSNGDHLMIAYWKLEATEHYEEFKEHQRINNRTLKYPGIGNW